MVVMLADKMVAQRVGKMAVERVEKTVGKMVAQRVGTMAGERVA